MSFPLISEYKDAVLYAEDNFKELTNLRPVLDDNGEPVMSSGNFAVVFKMKDESDGKYYAVKCFLKDQCGRDESYRLISEELENVDSSYLVTVKYFEKELFVDSANCKEEEFPVLLMDWVEGQTLDKYIKSIIDDENELSLLAYRFGQLAVWLIPQPFAHGDLKPDNILVHPDGSLVLVDYDGMFVPAMKGQKAREIGSPDFRHPLRSVDEFDEHIDDFSISSIALSLKAIACKPSLWNEFGATDRLLLSKDDYVNIGESECMKAICSLASDSDISALLGLFYIVCSRKSLNADIARCFVLNHRTEARIDVDYIERLFEKKKNEGKIEEFIRYCKENIEKQKHEGVSQWGLYKAYAHLKSNNHALLYLDFASSSNILKAKKKKAMILYGGVGGVKKDYKGAFDLLEECAKTNDPDSLCALAICYIDGTGTKRNPKQALAFFRKSAELGYANAQYMLAHWYYRCIFGQNGYVYDIGQKNIDKAIYWYAKASEQNHGEACWRLSDMYYNSKQYNIILAKYYSDKVKKINNSTHYRSVCVDDTFDERRYEYTICDERKLNTEEINYIRNIRILKVEDNYCCVILYTLKSIGKEVEVQFCLTHDSKVEVGDKILPNKVLIKDYRKNDGRHYYKLSYQSTSHIHELW